MQITPVCLIPFFVVLSVQDEVVDEKAKAVVVDVGDVEKKTVDTRLLSADPALNGAVVGVGVGVLGSLLVGALLNQKNNCNNRGRRDTASTRFLPGLLEDKKCPPYSPYNPPQVANPNYHQPINSGYRPSNSYTPPLQSGYQQPSFSGYPQPSPGYQQPNPAAFQQPGYHQPQSGYHQPVNAGYHQPGYQPVNAGYHPAQPVNSGYRQPAQFTPTHNPPTPSYTTHPSGHAPYQPAAPLPLGYTSPVRKTAPKPFQGGVRAAKSIGDPSRVKFGN